MTEATKQNNTRNKHLYFSDWLNRSDEPIHIKRIKWLSRVSHNGYYKKFTPSSHKSNLTYYCDYFLCELKDGIVKPLRFRTVCEEASNVGWSYKSSEEAKQLSDNYEGYTVTNYPAFDTESHLEELEQKDKLLVQRYEKLYRFILKKSKQSNSNSWYKLGVKCMSKLRQLQTPNYESYKQNKETGVRCGSISQPATLFV